jgi:glycosyltransferase involved in cell wall biosynthesis
MTSEPVITSSAAMNASSLPVRLVRPAGTGRAPRRIAVLAPPWIPVPPPGYGGIEAVVKLLCDALVRRGHEVTLFAAPGSRSAARVCPLLEDAHPGEIGSSLYESDHVACAWEEIERAAERGLPFDVVHDHSGFTALAMADRVDAPVVHTIHGPFDSHTAPFYKPHGRKAALVAISRSQAQSAPSGVHIAGVVPNPIRVDRWPMREQKKDYLLWVGRMDPVKGAHRAIQAARLAGRTLVLAGPGADGAGELLPRAREAARGRPAGALRRRGRRGRQAGAVRERGRAFDAGPMARAVRDGDGRGARVRPAGDRVPGGRGGRDRDRRRERDAGGR